MGVSPASCLVWMFSRVDRTRRVPASGSGPVHHVGSLQRDAVPGHPVGQIEIGGPIKGAGAERERRVRAHLHEMREVRLPIVVHEIARLEAENAALGVDHIVAAAIHEHHVAEARVLDLGEVQQPVAALPDHGVHGLDALHAIGDNPVGPAAIEVHVVHGHAPAVREAEHAAQAEALLRRVAQGQAGEQDLVAAVEGQHIGIARLDHQLHGARVPGMVCGDGQIPDAGDPDLIAVVEIVQAHIGVSRIWPVRLHDPIDPLRQVVDAGGDMNLPARPDGRHQPVHVGDIDHGLPPEPGHGPAPGAGLVRVERVALILQHGVDIGPVHRVLVVGAVGPVRGQGRAEGGSLAALGPPDEGEDLRIGAGLVGGEQHGFAGRADGDALLHRPEGGALKIAALRHVGKGIEQGLGLRFPVGPPQEGDHLGAGADQLRAEGGFAGALGHTPADRPLHGAGEIVVGTDVRKPGALRRRRRGQHGKQQNEDDGK